MKDKIDLIFNDLKNEVITEKQAYQRVLDLFSVMQQSEQLIDFLKYIRNNSRKLYGSHYLEIIDDFKKSINCA
jgi:hypothetical protein